MYVSWHCFSGSDSGKDSVKTSGLSWLNLSFLGLHPKQTEKGQEAQADHKPVRGFGRRMQNNAVLFCFLVQEQNSNFTCGVRENFEMMNTPVLETSLCAFLKRCDCTAPSFQKKRNSIAWKFSSTSGMTSHCHAWSKVFYLNEKVLWSNTRGGDRFSQKSQEGAAGLSRL